MSKEMPLRGTNLSAPELRQFLRQFVGRRVHAQDVDDVVQNVLADALASTKAPVVDEELRRWLLRIARYKIADHHRRAGREVLADPPEVEAPPSAIEARDLVIWVEASAPAADATADTLRWMAREGEGEKLEWIADDERVAATTVRKRVSRMRRWLRERWREEYLAVAGVGILALAIWYWIEPVPEKTTEVVTLERLELPPPVSYVDLERARALRREAAAVEATAFDPWLARNALNQLDRAAELDPKGDQAPEIQRLRSALEERYEQLYREQEKMREERRRESGSGSD